MAGYSVQIYQFQEPFWAADFYIVPEKTKAAAVMTNSYSSPQTMFVQEAYFEVHTYLDSSGFVQEPEAATQWHCRYLSCGRMVLVFACPQYYVLVEIHVGERP